MKCGNGNTDTPVFSSSQTVGEGTGGGPEAHGDKSWRKLNADVDGPNATAKAKGGPMPNGPWSLRPWSRHPACGGPTLNGPWTADHGLWTVDSGLRL
jgi:hypothetical protein